jgi:hypothetical protein
MYKLANPVTMDGRWTTADEWSDTTIYPLAGGLNGSFRGKGDFPADFSYIYTYILVEIVGDITGDAADSVVVCLAMPATFFGEPAGGTTPQTGCLKFEVNGTGATATLTVYRGTGTGWAVYTNWTKPADFTAAVSINVSERSATPHKIIELKENGRAFPGNFGEPWLLVAAFDASRSASGWQVWPNSSSIDSPNDYGLFNAISQPIPESVGVVAMALMSTVAVIVSACYLRKPKHRNNQP